MICPRSRAEEALAAMRSMMSKLELTVNETNTQVSKLPAEKFDSLGQGPYEILFAIGVYGMAEVYRSPDDQLNCIPGLDPKACL